MKSKNTICLWFEKDAEVAASFYAATFPDSKVTVVHHAPHFLPDSSSTSRSKALVTLSPILT
jgi:predicted 3-demethylubiquinone-9 3-methyltransferase (glyoxalase superfamily)